MPHVLPLVAPAAPRGFTRLQMPFAAPLRTAKVWGAEVWGAEAERPQAGKDRGAAADWPPGAAFALAIPVAVLFWAGLLYWVLT